jgi:hypothetical protein
MYRDNNPTTVYFSQRRYFKYGYQCEEKKQFRRTKV